MESCKLWLNILEMSKKFYIILTEIAESHEKELYKLIGVDSEKKNIFQKFEQIIII